MSSRYPQGSQPIPIPTKEANEKIRVGFVSGFFSNHSNWKIPIKGWIENLDRNKFELFGYIGDFQERTYPFLAVKFRTLLMYGGYNDCWKSPYTESTQDQFTARAAQAFVKVVK